MMLPALFFLVCLTTSDAIYTTQCPGECVCFGGFVSCREFTEDALTGLPANAETLVLYGGDIKSFPPGFLKNFTQLTFLEIHSTRVGTVLGGTFAGLDGLDQISLTSCTIGRIEQGAFQNMGNVSKFFVSDSKIGSILRGAFTKLKNIDQFSIWSSTIGIVQRSAFSGLSDFQTFSFYMNNVTVLSNDAFFAVENFGTVDIYLNRFISPIQGGSGMEELTHASTGLSVYSNVFACGCDFVKAFLQSPLSRFANSQKCEPEPGSSATAAGANMARLVKLSEVDANEVCADDTTTKQPTTTTTLVVTTSRPSTTSHSTSSFRPKSSKRTTTAVSNLASSSTQGSQNKTEKTTKQPGWTTPRRDSGNDELSGGDGGRGGNSANTGAGVSGSTPVLLQAALVAFLTALLVPKARPVASVMS